SAFYPTRLDESYFVTYMGTAPVNVPVAIAGLRQEVERLVAGQLNIEELDGAKSKLLGQYALGKQTNSEIAQVYGWYEILGLGIDYDQTFQSAIADITLGEIEQVATHYLQNPTLSVVGPSELALN
ncbi:MAG: insulinase family protein, partial [Cyanobacteria bacterium P01_H01_bin.15]